ncbi:hypothetical protein DPMN_134564 [Dreissena polymorpha]|uniref:Uncharacterized protein n=1 Tax=Dreissena polymorpha TaxID=45954 RepID=A0A9D4FWD4_DREPO|nr:hypothetical protein DPMN_134564 [Dreissena polymorpha]
MSFIEPQNVVAPKIDVAHYQEGDLIKATYQKQTYDAVISEIHRNSLNADLFDEAVSRLTMSPKKCPYFNRRRANDEVSLKASKATA